MNRDVQAVLDRMFVLDAGCPERIQHFTKVYVYAAWIGREEKLDSNTQRILELAAVVHDIGIKICLEKYGNCDGKLQEQEGPPLARQLLLDAGIEEAAAARAAFLVSRHHTYGADAPDWQILLEADFLVNGFEGKLSQEGIRKGYDTIFRTEAGRRLCRRMFGLETE